MTNNLCATEGCGRQGTVRFERGGVGSDYCPGCAASIEVLFRNDRPIMLSEVRKVIYRIAGQLKGQIPEQVFWGLADSIESHSLASPSPQPVAEAVAWQRRLMNPVDDVNGHKTGVWGAWKECSAEQAAYAMTTGGVEGFAPIRAEARPLFTSPQPEGLGMNRNQLIRMIMLEIQGHDFGHETPAQFGEQGTNFTTTMAQIDLLEKCCGAAADRILSSLQPKE